MEVRGCVTPKICLREVRKQYPARGVAEATTALADMSLDIFQGEFVCIVGPSGCGKSTVLNMIAGLVEPTGGAITLDGEPVLAPGAERGVVFQDYALFPWKTVRENVEFRSAGAGPVPSRGRRPTVPARWETWAGQWGAGGTPWGGLPLSRWA